MNYKKMGQFIAMILGVEAVFMVPALLISVFGGEWAAVRGFTGALAVRGHRLDRAESPGRSAFLPLRGYPEVCGRLF